MIVRKQGSPSTDPSDGTVVFQETTRNAYKDTPLYDSNVSYDITYYYTLYTQSDNGA